MILLVFLALSMEAYFGPGLRHRLPLSGWGTSSPSGAVPPRVFYDPGSSARAGQQGWGSHGQDRVLVQGDVVLLGDVGQLVRLGPGGRVTDLDGADGEHTVVTNVGAWDRTASRLAGVPARYLGGLWVMDEVKLQPVGALLHPAGAPRESLTDGFWVGPDEGAIRVRRAVDSGQPAVRLSARRKTPAIMLHTRQPLNSLEDTLVSVRAVVRGQPGKTVILRVEDTTDESGNGTVVTEEWTATEAWTELTVRQRVVHPSPNDRIALGLIDADDDDWIEVREFEVFLGVAP